MCSAEEEGGGKEMEREKGEEYIGEGIKCAKRSWNGSILKIEHGKERKRRKKLTGRLSQRGHAVFMTENAKENTCDDDHQ